MSAPSVRSDYEQLANLAQGRHLDVVDQTMNAVDKALGGTVTEGNLVR